MGFVVVGWKNADKTPISEIAKEEVVCPRVFGVKEEDNVWFDRLFEGIDEAKG